MGWTLRGRLAILGLPLVLGCTPEGLDIGSGIDLGGGGHEQADDELEGIVGGGYSLSAGLSLDGLAGLGGLLDSGLTWPDLGTEAEITPATMPDPPPAPAGGAVSTSAAPAPATAAPPAIDPGPICGPDITAQTEAVLARMAADFRSWSLGERASRCTALYAPTSFNIAWDILQLSPRVTPLRDDPATAEDESAWASWFERFAGQCARPREPCGPSVVFRGMCVHSQILNYMQWGAMNRLCGGGRAQDWQLVDWDAAAAAAARARTVLSGLAGGGLGAASAIADEQLLFTRLGARFSDLADATLAAREDFYTDADEGEDIRGLTAAYAAEVATAVADLAAMTGRAIAQCQMACTLTPRERAELDALDFGYIWGDYRYEGAGDYLFSGGAGGGRRGRATVNVIPGAGGG